MRYVLNTLKAEIKSLKEYIDHCKDRVNVFNIDPGILKKYQKEMRISRKRIQDYRDVINLINDYNKSRRQ
jgi:hypothetical protein